VSNESVVKTFVVDIYIGLKEGYDGPQHSIEELKDALQIICDEGLCVSVIPASYVYKGGREYGAIVKLINYPRFPSNPEAIKTKAILIANKLKDHFKQNRVSVQAPDVTYMIGDS